MNKPIRTPRRSSFRRVWISIFLEMSGMERWSSLKRRVPRLRQNKTIGVQVSAMTRKTCRAGYCRS